MKTKKSVFKKFIAMSLLLNLALTPAVAVIGNTVYAEKSNTYEDEKLPDLCLPAIDKKTGKKRAKEITLKVKTHPEFADWGEDEYEITSVNGVFDFTEVEDKGNLYTIEIVGNTDYQFSNIKKDKKDHYILKFDELKKTMRTSNFNGDEVQINSIIF